jgi:hypothetical protein
MQFPDIIGQFLGSPQLAEITAVVTGIIVPLTLSRQNKNQRQPSQPSNVLKNPTV